VTIECWDTFSRFDWLLETRRPDERGVFHLANWRRYQTLLSQRRNCNSITHKICGSTDRAPGSNTTSEASSAQQNVLLIITAGSKDRLRILRTDQTNKENRKIPTALLILVNPAGFLRRMSSLSGNASTSLGDHISVQTSKEKSASQSSWEGDTDTGPEHINRTMPTPQKQNDCPKRRLILMASGIRDTRATASAPRI